MQKLALRKLMKREKTFLESLTGDKGKSKISKASPAQLKVLSWILHYITTGSIPITQETVNKLKSARKSRLLELHFLERGDVQRLLDSPELQKTVLKRLSLLYSLLLKSVCGKVKNV